MERQSGSGRTILYVVITLIALVFVSVLLALSNLTTTDEPPSIVEIDWEDPLLMDVADTPLYVRMVRSGDREYLLYCAGDHEAYEASLFYITRTFDGEWSEPAEVPLNLSVYRRFDCVYDEDHDELIVTFCHWNDTSSFLYMARGDLDRMTVPQVIVGMDIGGGMLYWKGPWTHSMVISENGSVSVFYCWLSGASENLNELYLVEYDGNEWSDPERIGIGNSPHALQDHSGEVLLYSNLWTFIPGPQPSVDEWRRVDGEWKKSAVNNSAEGWNAQPCVVEGSDGTTYLVYDHNPNDPGTLESLLIQTRRVGEDWSEVHRIVRSSSRFGMVGHCMIVSGNEIVIAYIMDDRLYMKSGTIEE